MAVSSTLEEDCTCSVSLITWTILIYWGDLLVKFSTRSRKGAFFETKIKLMVYQIKLFQHHSSLNCCYKMRRPPYLFEFLNAVFQTSTQWRCSTREKAPHVWTPRATLPSVSSWEALWDRSALPPCSIIVRAGTIFLFVCGVLPLCRTQQTSIYRALFIGCVAVRSDHLCGVWRFAETVKPRLLQAINTTEVATCISVR